MNKTKVLCLFPRFYTGGVTKALSFVANTCDEAGMEVHCVSMTSEPETIHLNDSIIRHIIDTERLNSIIKSYFYKFLFLFRFRKLLKQIRPDVVIVFRPDLTKAVLYSIWGMKIPVIGSERADPMIYGSKITKYNNVYNKCSAVVFQTEAARSVYNLSVKSVIIPNPAVSRNCVNSENRIRSGKNIITVSRLSPEKNITGLLFAFAQVKDQLQGRKLIIYGDGPQQKELIQLALNLNLKDNVVFAGNVKDFTQQNDDASIFVLNTLSEGMPNALIEAMLSGYTCICTDCPIGAPRWLSDNERRVKLIPIKDDKALSQALIDVTHDVDMAQSLAFNALEVRHILDPKRISEMWLKLINDVLNK